MKKIFLIFALMLTMSFEVFAQRSDIFFKTNNDDGIYSRLDDPNEILTLPSANLGSTINEPAAPLGNGLIILTVLGVGYTIRKRK